MIISTSLVEIKISLINQIKSLNKQKISVKLFFIICRNNSFLKIKLKLIKVYTQDNIEELFKLIGKLPEHKFACTKNYDFISASSSIWPNLLFNFKGALVNVEKILDDIESLDNDLKLPNLLMTNPAKDNSLVIDRIKLRNYISSRWSAMTHFLNFDDIKLPILKIHLKIKLIDNKNDLLKWLEIVEIELMGKKKLDYNIFNYLLKEKKCYFYLGFWGMLPVATSFLFKGKTSAGVYLVSTLKTYRKKGIGKNMTFICLKKAKELKCKKVDIQATDFGFQIYKSLGFINYGDINVFRIQK